MSHIFTTVAFLMFFTVSCKSTKKTTEKVETKTETAQTLAPDAYRLIVSFISIGGGSDYKLKKEFLEFAATYATKIGKKIEAENFAWGREGEVDLCYKLLELNKKESDDFVAESKTFLSKSKLVRISENLPCSHKR